MESCLSVQRELDKVETKFTGLHDHYSNTIEDFISSIENIRRELAEGPENGEVQTTQSLIMSQMARRVREVTSRLGSEHKDLHSAVSKVGKAIDRNFTSDFSSVASDDIFYGEQREALLNQIICEHFLRQGKLDIAESLSEVSGERLQNHWSAGIEYEVAERQLVMKEDEEKSLFNLIKTVLGTYNLPSSLCLKQNGREAGLNLDPSDVEPFLEIHRILGALKHKNLQPALSWALANREALEEKNSSLEFKLHRLHFIDLLKQGPDKQLETLNYAKQFARFAYQYTRELQVLMGGLLFLRQGIETSPYAYLLDPIYWDEICDIFVRDSCALMGMSVESPLSVSILAGCKALPPLLNIRQVMQQKQVSNVWSNKEELPVEIDLGSEHRYHSIFACPILRQQSTEHNPPVRLICGHVISRDALHKLSSSNKVKCPYCPVEQNPDDAKVVVF